MSPRRAGEIALAVLVGSALSALTLVDGVEAIVAVVALLPAATAPWFRDRLPRQRGWGIAGFALLALLATLWLGDLRSDGVGVALVVLMVQQRLAVAEQRSDRLAILLAILLMVGAAARTESVLYLGLWVGVTASLPLAVWRPLIRSSTWPVVRNYRAGLSAGGTVLAAVLFFLLPRAFSDEPAPADVMSGFASRVELGAFHHLADDPTLIAELSFERGPNTPIRLRGSVLDAFDGTAWTSTAPLRPIPRTLDHSPTHRVAVSHLELGGAVLVPGEVTAILEDSPRMVQDVSDGWRTKAGAEVRYVAEVVLDRPAGMDSLPPHMRERYLALPSSIDPRIGALAGAVVGADASPAVAARRIERHLQGSYTYTRADVGGSDDPLMDFLFGRRRGHCEYFATAATVLARSAGIPARLVTGFAGGEPIPSGVRMRGTHAHAWTEVHIDGVGWVPVDGTGTGDLPMPVPELEIDVGLPAAAPVVRRPRFDVDDWWQRTIVGHDRARQVVWVRWAASAWEQLFALALVLLGVFIVRRAPTLRTQLSERLPRKAVSRPGVAGCLDEAMGLMRKRGFVPPTSLPPVDAARWVAERAGDVARPLVDLAWLHYEARYGGQERLDEARALVDRLQQVPRGLVGAPDAE